MTTCEHGSEYRLPAAPAHSRYCPIDAANPIATVAILMKVSNASADIRTELPN
jgi:hypothetical protein